MFKIYGKYGEVEIKGNAKEIEKTSIEELTEFLELNEEKAEELLVLENEYLSQIMN